MKDPTEILKQKIAAQAAADQEKADESKVDTDAKMVDKPDET